MKNKIVFFATFLFFLFSFIACNNADMKFQSVNEMVSHATDNVSSISIGDFHEKFVNAEHITIVDVREPEEFVISSIPGAINVPRGVLEFSIGNKVQNRHEPVYVYCDNAQRSALAVYDMAKLKFSNAILIESGFDVWQEKYPDDVQLESTDSEEGEEIAAPSSGGGCGG